MTRIYNARMWAKEWWMVAGLALASLGITSCREFQPLEYRGGPINTEAVPVLYDYYETSTFALSDEDWRRIEGVFTPAPIDAGQERRMIRTAVGEFERIAGGQTPVCNDARKNKGHGRGQTDCIAESTNTTTYLRLLDERGLLRWHTVMNKVYRGPLEFDTHWSAQIRDDITGERYAVDSWYHENGRPPYVQIVEDWKRKKPFPEDQLPGDLLPGLPGDQLPGDYHQQ